MQEIQREISRLYVDDLSKIRWQYFIGVPSDSFMIGATGVAYELMRIANNELPSIMLLNFLKKIAHILSLGGKKSGNRKRFFNATNKRNG